MESGYRESTESWAAILRDLKRRGLAAPKLVIGDGHLGIWGALAAVFPEAEEQRCWNHRIVNVLDKLPLKRQAEARTLLTKIPYAETREEAERQKRAFQAWCTKHGHAEVGRALDRDWERMVTFYQFPREHWKHLRTSNPVESPFAAVRLRTAAAKRFKKVENATAVIWKTLLIAEKTFRRLDAPELLADVAERRGLRQRSACCEPARGEGRRLISFTHFLTRPPSPISRMLPGSLAERWDARLLLVDRPRRRRLTGTRREGLLLGLEGNAMETIQDRLTLLLRTNRTVCFCDACLALKMGAFPNRSGKPWS